MATGIDALRAALTSLGFKKRAGDVFTCEIDEDVLGWLGLNRATRHRSAGEVEIHPVVGVRHQGVERIVAELRRERFHPYQPPTASSPLGYLTEEPRHQTWILSEDGAATGSIPEIIDAIERFGLPFVQSSAALPELCRLLAEGTGFDHQIVYRLPVARLLAGDARAAFDDLDRAEAALGERDDAAAAQLRAFAAAFRDRFEISA